MNERFNTVISFAEEVRAAFGQQQNKLHIFLCKNYFYLNLSLLGVLMNCANSLDPGQDQQIVGLDLDPNHFTV